MTTPHTAFPADGFTARWRHWDAGTDDTVTLRWENEGWTAMGDVGRDRVTYVIRLSPTWHIRQFLLFRDLEDPDLWLGTDGSGRWGEMNGAHRTDLDGCTELHLPITPFTDAIPIRRLQLDLGDGADLSVATVDVETLGVVPRRRRYEHIGERRWRITADPGQPNAHEFEVDVDPYGLPHDVPALARRN